MPEGAVTGTFGDYAEDNSEAVEIPNNYEICMRSGFKVKPENLEQQWDGLWVHKEFKEKRHPQDFVRGVPEVNHGSPRPERPDAFLGLSEILLTEDGEELTIEMGDGYLRTEAREVSAGDL